MKRVTSALVVDDNQELRENVIDILRGSFDDIAILGAGTAQEALAIAVEAQPDLALLDLHLPDIEATRIIEKLRQRAPYVQVVIVTGDSAVESAIAALERGAFSYVLKPFKGPALVEIAQRALERAKLLRERERLRKRLEVSERRYREVIESVPAFVLALDRDRRILLWNRQLELVTGYSREEMMGKPADEVVSEGPDKRLPIKDGSTRYARWRLAELPSAQDKPGIIYAVGVDVTEERMMQLRARRAERLAAVGTLAAGLAHEVRNPLNSASLQLEVLARRIRKQEGAAELAPTLEIVQTEIQRLDRLVNEFLNFARPKPLQLAPTNLNDELEKVSSLLRPEAAAAGVEIELACVEGLALTQAEPERMRQVFINLVRNAIEALGAEGGTVRLESATEDDSVVIRVIDDGPGFADDAPVFDAFFTTKDQGTGLGLAIVHRIVGDHAGSVNVTSSPGGTCFEIRIPNDPPLAT